MLASLCEFWSGLGIDQRCEVVEADVLEMRFQLPLICSSFLSNNDATCGLQFSSGCVAGGNCEAAAAVAVSGVGHKEHTVHHLPVSILLWLQLLQAAVSAVGEGEAHGDWSKSGGWCGCWCVHCFGDSGKAFL